MIVSILKWTAIMILSLFVLVIITLLIMLWPGTATAIPTVQFHYSPSIDRFLCPPSERLRILPSWHTDLKNNLPVLTQEWNKTGPSLLAETSKLTQKPFSESEFDIPLFLCPSVPGIGFPIMIPVRMFLKSAVVDKPWDKQLFVDMVFHELLHVYVVRALHFNLWTPLLMKYRNESINTKIHLHLFALQKAVYLHLGMAKRWQMVVLLNHEFSPSYSRAIAIVDQEGYQAFIDELRQ